MKYGGRPSVSILIFLCEGRVTIMGCGKSKQSVAINDSTLRKGESTNTATNNGGEIRFKPFPNKKENPDEITEAEAREVDGGNLNAEMRGELDGVDAKALPRPEDAKESREMLLLPREEGVEDEALGQEEERVEEKKDGILEEEKGAAFEEDKDASPEDGLGDRDEENRRLISHDSPDHYFSSRKGFLRNIILLCTWRQTNLSEESSRPRRRQQLQLLLNQ